jgi:hypothetical protein
MKREQKTERAIQQLYHAEGWTNMTDTMWKFEQLRAGQIYNQVMFNTREEAESFAAQMNRVEPDLFWRIEPIEAKLWWN